MNLISVKLGTPPATMLTARYRSVYSASYFCLEIQRIISRQKNFFFFLLAPVLFPSYFGWWFHLQ